MCMCMLCAMHEHHRLNEYSLYCILLGFPASNDGNCEENNENALWCFLYSGSKPVQVPLRTQNLTLELTQHAIDFIHYQTQVAKKPFYYFMSYVHVHTALYSSHHFKGMFKQVFIAYVSLFAQ